MSISSSNTSQNIIFQKSSYKNRLIGAKIPEATILYNESKHNILAFLVTVASSVGLGFRGLGLLVEK
jgi:hypothetical protein